jgi:ribose 5-phosphate isomerase B
MRLAIGSDHRGVACRRSISEFLTSQGHQVVESGGDGAEPVDYPQIAAEVARRVASGQSDRGILMCGTGIGVSIAANKIRGIRAAVCHDQHTAEMSRRHNDANVLCLSAEQFSPDEVKDLIGVWLQTEFEGGRHQRRVDQIASLESA